MKTEQDLQFAPEEDVVVYRQRRGQSDPSEEEKAARIAAHKTQGRKGCKLPRMNLTFSQENYDYLKVIAPYCGTNVTAILNKLVDKYREEHWDLYEEAIAAARRGGFRD